MKDCTFLVNDQIAKKIRYLGGIRKFIGDIRVKQFPTYPPLTSNTDSDLAHFIQYRVMFITMHQPPPLMIRAAFMV